MVQPSAFHLAQLSGRQRTAQCPFETGEVEDMPFTFEVSASK